MTDPVANSVSQQEVIAQNGPDVLIFRGDPKMVWKYNLETKRVAGPKPAQVWAKFGTWPAVEGEQPDVSGFNPDETEDR